MSPAFPTDLAILAAVPASGLPFPALAEALHLTQRKLHPIVRRLVERGALHVELRDGIRWVEHDGQTREELHAEVLRLRRAMARARNTLTRALGSQP